MSAKSHDDPPTLVLATSGARDLRAVLHGAGIAEVIALIPEYGTLVRLEAEVDGVAVRRRIDADLRAAADDLRRPFLELTAMFGRRYDSLAWWASGIAERNTNGSDLFLHCCYLWLARQYLDERRSVCIVCDAPALRSLIIDLARARNYRVRTAGRHRPRLHDSSLWPLATLVWKSASLLARWLAVVAVRGRGARRSATPDVLLSTRVDQGSIDQAGSVHDRYLPLLPSLYASKRLSCVTVLTIAEPFRVFLAMIRRLRRSPDCIVLEEHLRLWDLTFPALMWARQRTFRFRGATLHGLDVSRLFDASNRTESLSVMSTLHYPLMRRLAGDGIHPRLMVLPFENMVSDKLTILGVRRFMPRTLVYGFCHNPLKRNVLPWYTDRHERDIAPLPDRIVCNGVRYRDILVREGYAPERVVVGAALRYAYLHRGGAVPSFRAPSSVGGAPRVLLVLTTKRDGTAEVIDKFVAALAVISNAAVIVKPHPFARELADGVVAALGARVRVVDGTMEEALAESDVVVCAASGAVLEAALAGKRVVRISPESQLDMDPLAWFEEFEPAVSSPDALARRLVEVLSAKGTPPADAMELSSFFAPPTEVYMEVFLPMTGVGASA